MTPAIPDTSARQHAGGPSPVSGRGGNRKNRARKPGLSDIEAEIAGLLDRSTRELRMACRSFDPALVPKVGATLVRQWRGHAHTVLVRDDGFEYEGQHYRSLSVIAERITGAHWSGPRFFGLTKRTGASVSAEAGE